MIIWYFVVVLTCTEWAFGIKTGDTDWRQPETLLKHRQLLFCRLSVVLWQALCKYASQLCNAVSSCFSTVLPSLYTLEGRCRGWQKHEQKHERQDCFWFLSTHQMGLTQGLTGGGGLSNELGPNIALTTIHVWDIWWKREWGWGSCMWDLVLPPAQAQAGGPGSLYPWPQIDRNHKDRSKARGTNIVLGVLVRR